MNTKTADTGTTLPDTSHQIIDMDVDLLIESRTNPRTTFDQEYLKGLATTIKAAGRVYQAILARPLPASRLEETAHLRPRPTHEIVFGACRHRSTKIASLKTIRTTVEDLTDEQVLIIQLIENLKRKDLSALEEAEGYAKLMAEAKLKAEDVAVKIDRSKSHVYQRLKLLDLCEEARTSLKAGTIDATRAVLIARIPDAALQRKALQEVTRKDYNGDLAWGYREAAAHVQRTYMLRLDSARFKITDATLVPDAGSCKSCTKRTGHAPDLFDDVKSADTCTDPACFKRKDDAFTERLMAAAHERGQEVITGREAKALMPTSYGGVEGYLRLDDANDSPTGKPLRKLLGAQLDREEVQPTLIANPHKEGELIAVLPAATVAELLAKSKGQEQAAKSVASQIERAEQREAQQEKEQLANDYEQGWRTALLAATVHAVEDYYRESTCGLPEFVVDMLRHIALGYVSRSNQEKAKAVCKLLDLGKVAPKDSLKDHVKSTPNPIAALFAMALHANSEYMPWLGPDHGENQNGALLACAQHFGIDVAAIKAQTKTALKNARKLRADAKKALPATPPLAQPSHAAGQDTAQGTKPAVKKARLSAEDAQLGIAAAMQSQDRAATTPPEAQQDENAGTYSAGQRVRITTDDEKLGLVARKWAGKEGNISRCEGGGYWDVVFKGRGGGVACFAEDQLELVA